MGDDVPLGLQEDAEGGLTMWLVGDLRVKRWASNRPAYWLEIQAQSEIYPSESPSTGNHTLHKIFAPAVIFCGYWNGLI